MGGAHGANVPACDLKSWSLCSFLLLTTWCKYLLACREGPLSSTHPVELASNDRAAPYWLGAAQLEVSGSHLMKLQGLLPPSNKTPGALSYPNQSDLRTGKLPHHMLCRSFATLLEFPLQIALRPGWEDKERLGCP